MYINFSTQILRSCSMPDLSKLFRTTLTMNPFFEVEVENQAAMVTAAMTLNMDMMLEDLEGGDGDDEVEEEVVEVDEGEDGVDGGEEGVMAGDGVDVEEVLNQSL